MNNNQRWDVKILMSLLEYLFEHLKQATAHLRGFIDYFLFCVIARGLPNITYQPIKQGRRSKTNKL